MITQEKSGCSVEDKRRSYTCIQEMEDLNGESDKENSQGAKN